MKVQILRRARQYCGSALCAPFLLLCMDSRLAVVLRPLTGVASYDQAKTCTVDFPRPARIKMATSPHIRA